MFSGNLLGKLLLVISVALDEAKRRRNERVFKNWEELPNGGRRYWYEISGRLGWKARKVKEP